MRGKCLMVQGTGSSVGKSLLCAALLRILKNDGYSAAPFKAQNMALNSFVTKKGQEMGRAQVTQAQAAGIEPDVLMNPILLKPTSDRRSQVIVMGKPLGNMSAAEYHAYKPKLRETVRRAYEALESSVDFVIIEGAGSPAEINLREGDLVNMAMAETADAPVVLVGDINLGGVFASLYGTVKLLEENEQRRIRGFIINKFRGDAELLKPGIRMIEEKIGVPGLGVVPYMDIDLEDEDSVTDRFFRARGEGAVNAAIVRLKHISNFTDFQMLSYLPGVSLRYAENARDLEKQDIILIPGSKNTIEDLLDLRARGMEAALVRHAREGRLLMGICGGYQMLGSRLRDPHHVESSVPETAGLGLLDMDVEFAKEKTTVQSQGVIKSEGWLSPLNGAAIEGYEIHAGHNTLGEGCRPWLTLKDGRVDGVTNEKGNVLGTYLHGVLDSGHLWKQMVDHVRAQKGLAAGADEVMSLEAFREKEFDRLAMAVRQSLDMEKIYALLKGEC